MSGQAPSVVFPATVQVVPVVGSWLLQNDTPASPPIKIVLAPSPASQKPRPGNRRPTETTAQFLRWL